MICQRFIKRRYFASGNLALQTDITGEQPVQVVQSVQPLRSVQTVKGAKFRTRNLQHAPSIGFEIHDHRLFLRF
jgi:hypothetical protein